MLYYAEISELGELPNYEIESLELFENIPENLTYSYTNLLISKCSYYIGEKMKPKDKCLIDGSI